MEIKTHGISRWKWAKDLTYTVVFCTLIALVIRVLDLGGPLALNLIMSYSIGLPICLIIKLLLYSFKPTSRGATWGVIALGIILGTFFGGQIGAFFVKVILSSSFSSYGRDFLQAVILGITFGVIITFFFWSREKISAAKAQMQEERIKRLSSEKEALKANLRLLQAQVEPHFLFNTLSNIRSLMDTEPATAKTMLMDFIKYLRTSLNRTRDDMTTLGQEMEIVEAYLNIYRIRMGNRLNYTIDISKNLKTRTFPPMLLQPLVENAIKHGLEAKVDGGEVTIRAREENGSLRLEVQDNGTGFSGEPKSAVGLSNIRDRLHLLYGEKARLVLEENKPQGVKATIEVSP